MFCDKGFADGTSAAHSFAFAAIVIEAINIAATDAVKRPAGNNGARQTFVIEKLSKQSLINGTVKEPIAKDGQQIPLWIKVPLPPPPQTSSLGRHPMRRLPPKKATNRKMKSWRFMILACRTASFAAVRAGS
jgi:hypothetical protein